MNIQTVAEHAGVSVATVSRAFNFPDKVAPSTLKLVLRVASQLGYLPNASARTLRTQRSRVIGVILPTLLNPTFAECLQGIAEAAATGNYAIIPVVTAYEVAAELRAVQHLLAGNVDGMILVVSNPANSLALQQLQNAGVPYALAYNRHPAHPCVSVDSESASAEVVARFAKLGHRRIAMVSGMLAASDRSQQRYRGYLMGMENAQLEALPLLQVPFMEAAVDAVCEYLTSTPRPSAIFCSNDLLAIRCIRAAHRTGLRVPADLAVVGFDGIALGEDLTPALSTVAQPNYDIGRHAVELLISALAAGLSPSADDSLVLNYAFREGESYRSAAT